MTAARDEPLAALREQLLDQLAQLPGASLEAQDARRKVAAAWLASMRENGAEPYTRLSEALREALVELLCLTSRDDEAVPLIPLQGTEGLSTVETIVRDPQEHRGILVLQDYAAQVRANYERCQWVDPDEGSRGDEEGALW